jgi:transcriptional regulator with AAA-type ATPase domain/tetratricopeptide (TPR) repeat protein
MSGMDPLVELIGTSREIDALRTQMSRLREHSAARRLPAVLLLGETGTGKGLVARLLHETCAGAARAFIDVNCAAIPDTLLEAELFGFERGAFTDARQAKPGLFHAAHRGTLFLDEIALLPISLQAKLLTAIESRHVRRLGSTRSELVDVWIVAATSADLVAAVAAGRFRQDLYHRLATVVLELPRLHARGRDVLNLANHFIARVASEHGLPRKTLAADACQVLLSYAWPGNVRELANVVERVMLLEDGPVITGRMLGVQADPHEISRGDRSPGAMVSLDAHRREERAELVEALNEARGNIARAAARLGIPRNTLRYRMAKHGLNLLGVGNHAPEPETSGFDATSQIPTGITRRDGVRWERRFLALLRVDLVLPLGGQFLSETSRPVDVVVDKLQSFGGRLQEISPRVIIAAFGLQAVEDAPSQAALAALAIQKVAARVRGVNPGNVDIKFGLHVAQALVGQTDRDLRIDLDDMAHAATTLRALVEAAEAGAIVASPAAVPFLERRFELVPFRQPESATLTFYRVVRREPTGYGLGGRPLSPFVGHEHEVLIFGARLTQAERGHGQVVSLVGDPGVGKSRFVYEVTHSGHAHSWRVESASCASYGTSTPYLPVIELLRHDFELGDGDAPGKIGQNVTQALRLLDVHLEPDLPAVLALLDGLDDDAVWQTLDPPQRRHRTLDALKRLFISKSQAQPLLLIFEDVHWADSETRAFLDGLVEAAPTSRLLLLVTYRPEHQHAWGNRSYYTQLPINPLPPPDAQDLLDYLLGDDTGLDHLKQQLIARTEGNPFFLEETTRELIETGTLVGERGAYRLAKGVDRIETPPTVQAVLSARIDRLEPADRLILHLAAVIGKDVPLALLRATAHLPEASLRQALARLQRSEFLYEAPSVPDLEYTFKHVLTHDVAYRSLLQERRQLLHARIVDAIESLYAGRLGEQLERMAHHALRGELWEKALTYFRRAGAKALTRAAPGEARACLEQAAAALGHLPERGESLEQAIDLRFELCAALVMLGEHERVLGYLREAEALAERLDDRWRLGRARARLTTHFWLVGDLDRALESGQQAATLAEAVGDLELRVEANLILGQVHVSRGVPRRAREFLTANVGILQGGLLRERPGLVSVAVLSRVWLSYCLAAQGECPAAIAVGEEARGIAESIDYPIGLIGAYNAIGSAYLQKGDFRRAILVLERGLEVCRSHGVGVWLAPIASSLGFSYVLAGRVSDGVALLEEAVETSRRRNRTNEALQMMRLSLAYLRSGRRAEATELAHRALELARSQRQRGPEAWALYALGRIAAESESPEIEIAETYYRQAIAMAEELGLRPHVAHCHLGLGKLYRRTGRREQAQEHLTTATTMYREMGMTYWLEQAEPELARASG